LVSHDLLRGARGQVITTRTLQKPKRAAPESRPAVKGLPPAEKEGEDCGEKLPEDARHGDLHLNEKIQNPG
jgi:hypothetical protein